MARGQSFQEKLFHIPGTWLTLGSLQGRVCRGHAVHTQYQTAQGFSLWTSQHLSQTYTCSTRTFFPRCIWPYARACSSPPPHLSLLSAEIALSGLW